MKIVALIEDGHGHLHLIASRSPDLFRRDLSARTGTANLIWCAVPPGSVGAHAIVAEAMNRLGVQGPEPLAKVPTDQVIAMLTALCVTEPRRKARWRRLRQWRRGAVQSLYRPRRNRPSSAHNTSLKV